MTTSQSRASVFRELRRELKRKGVNPSSVEEVKEKTKVYITRLEQSMRFSTSVGLKEFMAARR